MFNKTKKFISAVVVLTMALSAFVTSISANSGNYSLGDTSELVYLSDSFIPTEFHHLGGGSESNSHCLFDAVTLQNEPFDKAMRYRKMTTTVVSQRWDIYCKAFASLDGVAYDTDDILMLSFYYKGNTTGTYYGGGEFTSSSAHTWIKSNNVAYNNLNDDKSQKSENFELVSDGAWHKVTLYMNAANYNGETIIYIPNSGELLNMLLADFRIGVVHLPDSWNGGYTNDVAYSTLSDVLMDYTDTDVDKLTVNGQEMDLTQNTNEFTVAVDSYNLPSVSLSNGAVGLEKQIKKLAYNRYEITPCAPAYNPTVADDVNIQFRVRDNDVQLHPEKANSTYIGTNKYYINLELDDNFTMFANQEVTQHAAEDLKGIYVDYTTYNKSLEKFDDALFPYGYSIKFLKHDAPEGTIENNALVFNYDFGSKKVNPGDLVYFQWYMKVDTEEALSAFTYRPRIIHEEEDYTINENLIPIGSGLGTYANHGDILNSQLNNGWFKCEGVYEAINGIDSKAALKIEFPWLSGVAMDIKVAEPACGILNFRDGDVPEESDTINSSAIANHKRSMIRDVVSTMDPVAIVVDGEVMEIADKNSFNVSTAELDNNISLTGLHTTIMADVNKSDITAPYTATIRAYAPGFDKTKGVSGQTASYLYRKYKKDAQGNWSYAGQLDGPLSNANMYKDYTLNVTRSEDFAEKAFYVDGNIVSDYSNLSGSSFAYKELISKPENTDSIWAIFAAYEGDVLVSVKTKQYDFADAEDKVIADLRMNVDNSDESLTFKVFMFDNNKMLTPVAPALVIEKTAE